VAVGVADPDADALADGFAFFLVADGDGVGGGESVAYS